jgi:cGMP-dependent protein kinase
MVERKSSQETYALKQLGKGHLVETGMQQSVTNEKDVLLMCDSPFVVRLFETFNNDEHLELLLELALGGELCATYNKKQFYGKEDHAQFYVAGTTFAFVHLHSKKIIFRDLKPENLLLNERGQVKLTDMGFAKVVVGKTYTTCGTPDYFAPELIASKGHSHALDWWTLGILTFELMVGHPPFESASPMQIYQKVNKGIDNVNFPKRLGETFEGLVKALCHASPIERLPMKKGEASNIKAHPWFGRFDWYAMEHLTMKPPYQPQVKSKRDKGNFEASEEDLPPQAPYDPKDDRSGWDEGFATSP